MIRVRHLIIFLHLAKYRFRFAEVVCRKPPSNEDADFLKRSRKDRLIMMNIENKITERRVDCEG